MRPKSSLPFIEPKPTYTGASRLEVMRIGPIEQAGFIESGRVGLWFYHAVGSGIFVRVDDFASGASTTNLPAPISEIVRTNARARDALS